MAVKAGDVIPLKGIEMKVVCAGGKVIAEPLAGAGQPNPYCAGIDAAVTTTPKMRSRSAYASSTGRSSSSFWAT